MRAQTALIQLTIPGRVAISRQVVREYIAVMTRPQLWARAVPVAEAVQAGASFLRLFKVLEDGQLVWDKFRMLGQSADFGGKQVHDANIVATMLAYGETRLLTFNAADFRRFGSLIEIIEP